MAQKTAAPAEGAPAVATGPNDIVVTGIRRSLAAARDIKRESTQFVDAIVAGDIGKLPDTNVAESLARVSGVQVDRGIGEGTDISIRGLRQNVILFDGRQIYDATGRGGNGLDQLGTSTYGLLALVPSGLISRLSVTKLAGADQIAGSIGGVVDIQTRKPLEGTRSQIAASAALSYDQLAKKPGFELFGIANTRTADGTLGILVTASYSQRDLSQQSLDTFSGYRRFSDATVTPAVFRFGNADVRAQEINERRRKLGLSGTIQWQPSTDVEIIADTFYSKLDSDRNRHWLSFNPTAGLSGATYSPNNILLKGAATTAVLTNTEFATVGSDVWSSAVRGKVRLSDAITTSAEVSYGRSTSSYRQLYFRLQPISTITPTVAFDFTNTPYGSFVINGINLTDPAQLRFTILFDQLFRAKTDSLDARSDWTVDTGNGFLDNLQFGARYSRLHSLQNPLRADIRPAGGLVASSLGDFVTTYANPNFLPQGFMGLPRTFLAANPNTVTGCAAFTSIPAISQNIQCTSPGTTTNSLAGTFQVKERFVDAYGKLNFGTELAASKLTGNVGLRYVDRDLTSIGNIINAAGGATPTVFLRQDREWLPSGVAKLAVGKALVLRLGAAKVVAFPNTEDLNNGVTLSNNAVFVNGVQTSPGTGTGGAPGLNPFKAKQLDGSIEYYFGKQALVSLGLFYKDISSFIVQRQSAESYGGVNYLINRNVNGAGAKVKGVEMLAQLPFYFLPAPFDGFGIVATYSLIDSKTPITDISGRTLPFPGLSKNNVNLIGYYERGPLSVRVAYNWRDQYLVGLSAAATGIYNDKYTDLSTTIRFDFDKAVSLSIEGNNLLNSRQRTYDGVREALRTNAIYGRQFKAKISVKF
ncbi:TonB-dependent receptor [Sphingomonas sp. RB1R13]|uniref:TonB-dependent receptor n=1 Tax=Sphingomonas sp. RB1R13 TaxID=3096159 RepID=UPI002FCC6A94